MPRPQQRRKAARQIQNRRFDTHLRRAAIQHMDARAELVADVLRRGRADMPEPVRRRPRNAAMTVAQRAERIEQSLRDRMRRAADRHRILPAADRRRHMRGALQDQRERARPEGIDQSLRIGDKDLDPVRRIAAGARCTITG